MKKNATYTTLVVLALYLGFILALILTLNMMCVV